MSTHIACGCHYADTTGEPERPHNQPEEAGWFETAWKEFRKFISDLLPKEKPKEKEKPEVDIKRIIDEFDEFFSEAKKTSVSDLTGKAVMNKLGAANCALNCLGATMDGKGGNCRAQCT